MLSEINSGPKKEAINISKGVTYIIRDGEKFLLSKRIKEDSNFFGSYVFPAGRVESEDSSALDAVKREVEEERGVVFSNAYEIGEITFRHPNGWEITLTIFLIDIENIEGQLINLEPEKEELHWKNLEDCRNLCTTDRARKVLEILEEYLAG